MNKRTIVFCYGATRAKELAHTRKGEYVSMMLHPMDVAKLLKRFKDNKIGPLVCDQSMITGWYINEKVNEPIAVEFDESFSNFYGLAGPEALQAKARVKRMEDLRTDTSGKQYIGEQVGELDDGGE